jgi:hypothetical protein
MNYILIDNFLENPDLMRNVALASLYEKSNRKTSWKGHRSFIDNDELIYFIKNKLIDIDDKFKNITLEVFFHYTLDDTKNEIHNFEKNRLHKDETSWAGVIYLTPNPPKNCGTTLHDDTGVLKNIVDNVYNRFILYNGSTIHGVQDTFGEDIHNARLTITIFGNIDKKEKTFL